MRLLRVLVAMAVFGQVLSTATHAAIDLTIPGHASNIGYSAATGEIWLDDWTCTSWDRTAPRADGLITAHALSEAGLFTHADPSSDVFGGLFDVALAGKLFKLDPRGIRVTSLGRLAEPDLSSSLLQSDLSYDSGGAACESVANGLNYFPTPNLSTVGVGSPISGELTYKAVNGEVVVSGPAGMTVPWIGLYSVDGIFEHSEDSRDIATRIQYAFDVSGAVSLGQIARPRLARDELMGDVSMVSSDEARQPVYGEFELVYIAVGDINEDELIDADDIDQLSSSILSAVDSPATFDLNGDGVVNRNDRIVWVHDVFGTYMGDANLDGVFDSTDLSVVFQADEYFDSIAGNSTWATGDWNGDGDFNSGDLVAAFKDNGYEKGPRPAMAVPEPALNGIGVVIAFGVAIWRRRLP